MIEPISFDAFYSGHYEVTEDPHATTLKTASPPAALAGMRVRRLTPIECERLMGWPDNHTAGVADSHRYRMCGNGVASPVAEWIGWRLLEAGEP